MKLAKHSKLDDGVLMWLKQARGQNLAVGSNLIKEKALKLAELMHIPNFMLLLLLLSARPLSRDGDMAEDHRAPVQTSSPATIGWTISRSATASRSTQCRVKLERWISNPFLSVNNRFSSPYSGSSPQTTSSTWTRLESSCSCFRTKPGFQGRTVYWRKEEHAKDYSSGRGKNEWHREVSFSGDWQIQETPFLQEQGDSHQVQGKLKSGDDGKAFRRGVASMGRTTRPAGTQSAALFR